VLKEQAVVSDAKAENDVELATAGVQQLLLRYRIAPRFGPRALAIAFGLYAG